MADDANELAARLKRIRDLSDALTKSQDEHVDLQQLANRINQDLVTAREQLKQPPKSKK